MSGNYRRILIIKPGAIGDLLQLTPVIRLLHERYPAADISVLVSAPSTASLFHDNPSVKEAIIFDKKGRHRSPSALLGLWRQLRGERFDLVINFQRSNVKAWFLATAAFPCRVLVYHKNATHAVVNHLETLRPLGILPDRPDLSLVFHPSAADHAFAGEVFAREGLSGNAPFAFNPGTAHDVKNWPVEHFALLADRLDDRYGLPVLLFGSPAERELTGEIARRTTARTIDLAGCTLGQLGALLMRCRLLVTGDTGPMHLATAVGCRVVALYGPIGPERSGPAGHGHRVIIRRDIACVPCNTFSCTNGVYRECMNSITVDEVFTEVAGILSEEGLNGHSGRNIGG